MGAPGCPEFAFCTASMARVRMVLMLRMSSCLAVTSVCSLATIVDFSTGYSLHSRVKNASIAKPRSFGKDHPRQAVYQVPGNRPFSRIGNVPRTIKNHPPNPVRSLQLR